MATAVNQETAVDAGARIKDSTDSHAECEARILTATARGLHGQAEYLAARCDLRHGPEPETPEPNPHVDALRAELTKEDAHG